MQVALAPLLCLFLIKFLLALEWVIYLFFGHRRCLGEHTYHHHLLPLERALKAVLISEDHTYQGLVFDFFGIISIILFTLSIKFVIG